MIVKEFKRGLEFSKPIVHRHIFLKEMIPVVKQWQRSIVRYCDAHPKDGPYWYNERTNISLLAAGAWQSGAIALEEYTASKRRHRSLKDCRCDLYIRLKKRDAQIEAKHWWLRAAPKDIIRSSDRAWAHRNLIYKKKIKRAFKSAAKAARANTESDTRIACVFFTVGLSEIKFPNYRSDPPKYIRAILHHLITSDADMWAWCFPEPTRKLCYTNKSGVTTYWPGILMAMKVI